MKEIIRKEYIKRYDECPSYALYLIDNWNDGLQAFTDGWRACEEWQAEQDAMSKDYQEQVQEEARLAGGLG